MAKSLLTCFKKQLLASPKPKQDCSTSPLLSENYLINGKFLKLSQFHPLLFILGKLLEKHVTNLLTKHIQSHSPLSSVKWSQKPYNFLFRTHDFAREVVRVNWRNVSTSKRRLLGVKVKMLTKCMIQKFSLFHITGCRFSVRHCQVEILNNCLTSHSAL